LGVDEFRPSVAVKVGEPARDFNTKLALTLIEDQPDLVVLDIDDTEVGAVAHFVGRSE